MKLTYNQLFWRQMLVGGLTVIILLIYAIVMTIYGLKGYTLLNFGVLIITLFTCKYLVEAIFDFKFKEVELIDSHTVHKASQEEDK